MSGFFSKPWNDLPIPDELLSKSLSECSVISSSTHMISPPFLGVGVGGMVCRLPAMVWGFLIYFVILAWVRLPLGVLLVGFFFFLLKSWGCRGLSMGQSCAYLLLGPMSFCTEGLWIRVFTIKGKGLPHMAFELCPELRNSHSNFCLGIA